MLMRQIICSLGLNWTCAKMAERGFMIGSKLGDGEIGIDL